MKDYRWRLTHKVKRVLKKDHPVVIIAGPKMGKRHMVKLIKASGCASRILEDVAPETIPELIRKPTGTLITTDISFLQPSVAYKEMCFRVPLTTIMPKQLSRWDSAEWISSGGHPALAAASHLDHRRQISQDLQTHWNHQLSVNPSSYDILEDLRSDSTSSPAENYQRIRKRYGKNIKPSLDWLVCLGVIHRQKYRHGAGICPTPLL